MKTRIKGVASQHSRQIIVFQTFENSQFVVADKDPDAQFLSDGLDRKNIRAVVSFL